MVFSVFINFSHSQQNPNTFIIYDKDNETKELKEPEEDNDTEHIQTLWYKITREQYQELISRMITKVIPEQYGKHTICNVYLDTDDFQLIRNSLEKLPYKEKLRLRSYGTPKAEDLVYLELKKKYDGVVYMESSFSSS